MSRCPSCGYKATKKVAYLGGPVLMACPRCEAVLRANPLRGRTIVFLGNTAIVGVVVGLYLATHSGIWTVAAIVCGCILSVLMPTIAGDYHRWEAMDGVKAAWRSMKAKNSKRRICPHCNEKVTFNEYMDFMADLTGVCPRCFTHLSIDVSTRRDWREFLVWAVFGGCLLAITRVNNAGAVSPLAFFAFKITSIYILIVIFEVATLALRSRNAIYQLARKPLSEAEFEAQLLAELKERQVQQGE